MLWVAGEVVERDLRCTAEPAPHGSFNWKTLEAFDGTDV
jgi:hypothetical protein